MGESKRKLQNKNKAQETKKKYNLPDKFILYVGDATWNKNLPRLLEAFQASSVPLVLVGKALLDSGIDAANPWNKDIVEVQRVASSSKNIIRVGFVADNDLVDLYNCATVSVMPSLYEGFGLPVLEAMQCGSPVVTAKTGSLQEVAGNAALYVDPYDVKSIHMGIQQILDDSKLRDEYIAKGFKQAEKFTWEKTANETIKVYEKILEN